MDVSVVVGTFGAPEWRDLAYSRAIPSVPENVPVIHRHGQTLAQARNEGLALVDTEWVIHLDADDELSIGYIDFMAQGTADVRGPVACYIREGRGNHIWQPRVWGHEHDCTAECLPDGNWLLIGSAVRTDLIRRAGGWRDWPVYEDWDLFLRCHLLGASFELVRDAIYRAWVNPESRNRGPSIEEKNRVHHEIVASVLGEDAVAA